VSLRICQDLEVDLDQKSEADFVSINVRFAGQPLETSGLPVYRPEYGFLNVNECIGDLSSTETR
jgi:hypothetical protein